MSYCIACGRMMDAGAAACECGQAVDTAFQGNQLAILQSPSTPHYARFLGDGGTLLLVHLVNVLLTILTAGVYYFWAKAKVRRYLYGQTEFAGARFGYHGTGFELLKGFARAAGFFLVYFVVLWILQGQLGETWGPIVASLLLYLVLLLIIPTILIGAWRFAMSRTSYRGIRFSYSANHGEFFRFYLRGALLSMVSLGFYTPVFLNDLRGWFCRGARYGNMPFGYDGEGRELIKPYIINLLLLIPTLGICSFWFRARLQRHFWNHTTFGPARFNSTITGGGLLKLTVVNLLLVLFTLGMGLPWARVRSVRYLLANLSLVGPLDFDAIVQDYRNASATGEALGDMLDIGDTGFDAGI